MVTSSCSSCRAALTRDNASPGVLRDGSGYCRSCSAQYQRQRRTGGCDICGDPRATKGATRCARCSTGPRQPFAVRDEPHRASKRPHINTPHGFVYMTAKGRPSGKAWETIRSLVFNRDQDCWICHLAIDYTLRGNHLDGGAPTVDHVVPIHLGGDPVDLRNLRAAHRSCNSTRGVAPPATEDRIAILRLALALAAAGL